MSWNSRQEVLKSPTFPELTFQSNQSPVISWKIRTYVVPLRPARLAFTFRTAWVQRSVKAPDAAWAYVSPLTRPPSAMSTSPL
jgi:hypothetical protein